MHSTVLSCCVLALLASLALANNGQAFGKQCSIAPHGASSSSADNAAAIQAALDECSTGGTVTIAGGTFKSGPLSVRGHNVELVIAAGATLETAYGPDKWPTVGGAGKACIDILVFDACFNCTLSGGGTLFGRGGRPDGPNGGDDWYYLFDQGKIPKEFRPHYLRIQDSSDFTLRSTPRRSGLTILDAPKFNVVVDNSTRVEIDGLNITSTWYTDPKSGGLKEPHNTDGIDPGSSSSFVHIHDVWISNGDDSVAVKPATPCTHDILVENSHFHNGHGASIGSVGSECVKNVVFRNITMSNQEAGCRVKTYTSTKGNGTVSNITWENIVLTDVDSCITVNANYKPAPKGAKFAVAVSDLVFRNIQGTGCGSKSKPPAEFVCPKGSPCTGILLNNIDVVGPSTSMVCENAFGSTAEGRAVIPASCLAAPPGPSPPGLSPSPPPPPPPSPSILLQQTIKGEIPPA